MPFSNQMHTWQKKYLWSESYMVWMKRIFEIREHFVDTKNSIMRDWQNRIIQGDPKQTQIFQTDHTWPKMTFWEQIENFLSIWVYEYLLYLMIFNFWEFFIKINVIWKFMLILLFLWNWVFFVKLPIFFCGFIIFWWNWNSKFVTQSKWVFKVQLLSYNFTRKCENHRKRCGISQTNNSNPWK